jgi:hypothetical protein
VSRQAGSIVRGIQSRAGDPKNGPAAGSGYVLWSQRKVKARKSAREPNTGDGWRRKPASGERFKAHARLTIRADEGLAANRRQLAASRRADRTNVAAIEALKPRDGMRSRCGAKFDVVGST